VLTRIQKIAFGVVKMANVRRFATFGGETLAFTVVLLAYPVIELGLLSPNNSFKPSPLRGLGRAESHRAGRLNSGVRRH